MGWYDSEDEKKTRDPNRRTEYGKFGDQDAKINFSDNNRRMDIYYGGDAGDQNDHNHVVVVNDSVVSWREDGETFINQNGPASTYDKDGNPQGGPIKY